MRCLVNLNSLRNFKTYFSAEVCRLSKEVDLFIQINPNLYFKGIHSWLACQINFRAVMLTHILCLLIYDVLRLCFALLYYPNYSVYKHVSYRSIYRKILTVASFQLIT